MMSRTNVCIMMSIKLSTIGRIAAAVLLMVREYADVQFFLVLIKTKTIRVLNDVIS